MLRVINNDIHLTKGDTGYIALTIKNSKGNKYIVRDGDTLTLTVKKNLTNAEVIKKQVNANEVISILPSDTQDLNVGRYKSQHMIRSEVLAVNGLGFAERTVRNDPRDIAVTNINKMFGLSVSVAPRNKPEEVKTGAESIDDKIDR